MTEHQRIAQLLRGRTTISELIVISSCAGLGDEAATIDRSGHGEATRR